MRNELGETRGELGQIRNEVVRTRSELGETRSEFGQIRNELGKIRNELEHTRSELAQTRSELAPTRSGIMERLDQHAGMLCAIREDISVNIGAVDAGTRSHETIRQDVRHVAETVSALHRRIRTLEERVIALEQAKPI